MDEALVRNRFGLYFELLECNSSFSFGLLLFLIFSFLGVFVNSVMPIFLTRSLAETQKTYEAVGFSVFREAEKYLIMRLEDVELHFGEWDGFESEANICAAYIRTDDLAFWEKAFAKLGWEGKGIPRVSRTLDHPWGMREFHVVDTMGNLIKVGSVIKKT